MELILVTFVYVILGAIISFEVMKVAILPAILLIGMVYFARFVGTKYFAKQFQQYNKFLVYRKKSDKIWQQNFNDYFKNYQIVNNELVRA